MNPCPETDWNEMSQPPEPHPFQEQSIASFGTTNDSSPCSLMLSDQLHVGKMGADQFAELANVVFADMIWIVRRGDISGEPTPIRSGNDAHACRPQHPPQLREITVDFSQMLDHLE